MNEAIRAIFEKRKAKVEHVPLPPEVGEWYVREMTAAEYVEFNREYDEQVRRGRHLAWFASFAACDSAGVRMFEATDTDLQWIVAHVPGWVLGQVWSIGGRLNAITKEGEEALEKNSKTATPESSS